MALLCHQAVSEGWTSATVARHYLTCQRQKGPSEKAKTICFGPISNLWHGAQLLTVSELFWGRNLELKKKKSTFSVLLALSFQRPQTLRPAIVLLPRGTSPDIQVVEPGPSSQEAI